MKYIRQIFIFIVCLILILVSLLYISGYGYLIKAVRMTYLRGSNTAMLDDYKFFNNRVIFHDKSQPWIEDSNYNKFQLTAELEDELESNQTVAFLVIKNGKLLFEKYWEDYHEKSLSNSFSMAKTMVTMCLGKAIEEGYIKSLDQKVSDFFSNFNDSLSSELSVGDLSRMSSGLEWEESYTGPFSITTKAYFDENLDSLMLNLKVIKQPGQKFEYLSGDTQLLSLIITKATGQSLSNYFSEKFWKPLGMNDDAQWSLDMPNGVEKAYCCVNSNARNFAKFGQLFLQSGNWNGKQLLDSAFVNKMIHPAFKNSPQYGYSLWMDWEYNPPIYYMQGHLGQFVIVVPSKKLVIVRLGKKKNPEKHSRNDINISPFVYVDEVLKTTND